MIRRTLVVLCGSIICLMALACPGPLPGLCPTTLAFTRTFHFESDCDTDLCGFTVTTGTASRVGTFNPGEHGMQVDSGSSVSLPFVGPSGPRGNETIQLLAICPQGAQLTVGESLSEVLDGGGTSAISSNVSIAAGTDWAPFVATFPSGTPATTGFPTVSPQSLSFTVSGPGPCVVDEITYQFAESMCPDTVDMDARVSFDAHSSGDASADAAPPGLFSSCVSSIDCEALGSSATCLTQFPGGVCTVDCSSDIGCGSNGYCVQGICLPSCDQGTQSCDAFGAACVTYDPSVPDRRVCSASCFSSNRDLPSIDFPLCLFSEPCNPYTGNCGDPTPTGADNGAPCTVDSDCKGRRCITESDPSMPTPSGFIGGDCVSFGYRVPDWSYAANQPLPQGNCPDGSAPFPLANSVAGDEVFCIATCNGTTAVCRAGYQCQTQVNGVTYATGFCMPVDCSQTGMTCPTGYVCAPSAGDAGTGPQRCTASP